MLRVHCAVPEIRSELSEPHLHRVSVIMARGKHPVPFRTRKLSLSAPMVLHGGPCGRLGRRRTFTPQGWPFVATLEVFLRSSAIAPPVERWAEQWGRRRSDYCVRGLASGSRPARGAPSFGWCASAAATRRPG